MRKYYEPKIDVLEINTEDIIQTSGVTAPEEDGGFDMGAGGGIVID